MHTSGPSAPRLRARVAVLAFTVLGALASAACEDEFVDEPFGVLDLAHLYDGGTPGDPAAGLPRQIDPAPGFMDGVVAEYYDFGLVPVATNALTGVPTGARVQPMYFFFTEKDGFPLFSRPVREKRDGADWMKGGKNVLDPNPKDFCAGVTGDKAECERLNNDEKRKPYPARRRDPLVDPLRGGNNYQRPVVNSSPQDLGEGPGQYTGFWEIVEVSVPGDFQPDSIKHVDTLEKAVSAGKLKKRHTSKVIDCPIVDERTYVTLGVTDRKIFRPVIEVWYKRRLAFCYLAHGWETLGNEQGDLFFAGSDAERVDTFDVSRLILGKDKTAATELVVPVGRAYEPVVLSDDQSGAPPAPTRLPGNIVTRGRARHGPGDAKGYTPLRWMHDFEVLPEYLVGGVKSLDGIDVARSDPRRTRGGDPIVHNLAMRGTAIPCSYPKIATDPNLLTKREECGIKKPNPNDPLNEIVDSKGDPACTPHGLECNKSTCFCDVPFVGYGQRCGPGIARCNPDKDDFSERGYFCFPPWGGFCHLGCGGVNERAAENEGKELKDYVDSRCKSVPGYVCYGRRFCIKFCDENVSDPGQCKAEAMVGMETKDINEGMTCQDWGLYICTWPENYTPKL